MSIQSAEFYGSNAIQLRCDRCCLTMWITGGDDISTVRAQANAYGWGLSRQYLETEHGTAMGPEKAYCPECIKAQPVEPCKGVQ